ncbi:alpha-amylase family glycosyl hydrolase [Vibrio metschnikovii]
MYNIMVNQQGVSEQEMLAILAQNLVIILARRCSGTVKPYAGFSQGQPWLGSGSNYPQINAEQALADKNSVFYFYQRLIELRKTVPVITHGDYRDLLPSHPAIFAYQRQDDQQILLCINNYYDQEEVGVTDELPLENARYLLGNYAGIEQQSVLAHQVLNPYETRVIVIDR